MSLIGVEAFCSSPGYFFYFFPIYFLYFVVMENRKIFPFPNSLFFINILLSFSLLTDYLVEHSHDFNFYWLALLSSFPDNQSL